MQISNQGSQPKRSSPFNSAKMKAFKCADSSFELKTKNQVGSYKLRNYNHQSTLPPYASSLTVSEIR
jgi:hypothetical protein